MPPLAPLFAFSRLRVSGDRRRIAHAASRRRAKALARFEEYTSFRDFKTFRKEQAIGFKERLAGTNSISTGEMLSRSTQATTLAALKDFFFWLAWQPGFKSKIHVPDIEYLSLSKKDAAVANRRGGYCHYPHGQAAAR